MTINIIQPNSGIIRIPCPNSAYQQEHRCEIEVRKVKTLLDGLIKGWPVQKWHVAVAAVEIKINTAQGEVQVWKVIVWRRSYSSFFPLKQYKQRKRHTKKSTHRFNVPKLCPFSLRCRLRWAIKSAFIPRVFVPQLPRRLHKHRAARFPEEP